MNTNSITKFFTLVSIFVVTGFMAANTASAADYKTREECVAGKTSDREAKCDSETDATKKDSCLNTAARQASKDPQCLALPTESKAGEGDQDCEEAFREYKKNLGDAQSACEGLVGKSSSTKQSCSDKIKECDSMAASTSSQTEQQDGGISSTLNIFRAVVGGEESLGLSGSSCLIDIDSKEARDAEKEFRDRRKELTDEKKKIEDEAIKDKKENDKEITRITKEIQELQRENKKLLAEVDTKMREKSYDTQKELIAAGARLKDLTKQSSKTNDKIRALNFSFADRMLDTSAQKQNLRCKGALDTAKSCMIKSAKGIADPACKDFPFTIKSKGPKATAELKAQLQVVSDACYEKEERDRKRLQFDQQEQLTTLQRDLTGIQEQIEQEGKTQQTNSENSQKIQQEAEREKQEAQANLAEQTATLQGEMAQFAQELQLKSQKAQERLQKLAQDLQTLELEEKTGKRSKTKLASRAVRATNADLAEVKAMCECKDDLSGSTSGSKKRESVCKKTKDTIPSGGEEKKKRSTGKSGSTF
ncbi:hypothetical protein [Pseudobdellovibrio sp. HCB154]|uniref:hypothetical protein n=1 Tax=Pseudobdellovibrio sp. HCB154 TaxID=3386277 RepID=UPI003916FD11